MKDKVSQIFQIAATTAMVNSSASIVVGVALGTTGLVYKYGTSILHNAAVLGGIYYGNNKLADTAIEQGNAGLYDYTATIAKGLSNMLPGWFSEVDSARALDSGINNSNPEMVDVALAHGADANREIKGVRVLEKALNINSGTGNLIAQKLMQNGADLSNNVKEIENSGNLFHKVIASGKKELVTEALNHALKKGSLVESVDKDGNTLAHIAAVSPDVREALQKNKVELTDKAINAANTAGKNGIDAVMYGYEHEKADVGFVGDYIDKGSVSNTQEHFRKIVSDEALAGKAELIVDKEDFSGVSKNNDVLLDYAVNSPYLRDEVVKKVVEKTSEELLANKHMHAAMQNSNLKEAANLIYKKAFQDEDRQKLFVLDPEGSGQGSLIQMMADKRIPVNIEMYKSAYLLMKNSGQSLHSTTDKFGSNPLYAAATSENKEALEMMFALIAQEGIMEGNNLSLFTNINLLAALHNHGFADSLKSLADADKTQTLKLTTDALITQIKQPLAIEVSNEQMEGRLVVKQEFLDKEQKYLESVEGLKALEKKKALQKQESLRKEHEKQEKKGIPEEIVLNPMEKPAVKIDQNLAITGGLMKQAVMSKGLVTALTGSDMFEGNIPLWAVTFGTGGYLEAFGKNHADPLKESVISIAVYGVTEYMTQKDPSTVPGYTPAEERGIFDFVWKYGSDIATSSLSNLIIQGASAYTGGYVGSAKGILKSVGTAAGISTMKSYNNYTTDKAAIVEESSYRDYFTFENVTATGAAAYAGYYAGTAAIEVITGVAVSASVPVVVGAALLHGLNTVSAAHSAFGVAKLTNGTLSSLIKPVKEYTSYAAASAGDKAYDFIPNWWYKGNSSDIDCYPGDVTPVSEGWPWTDTCPIEFTE